VGTPGQPALDLRHLRWLVPTGEALPPELARQWLSYFPSIPLVNAYGPTECSDDVTHFRIESPPGPEVVNMPIGRPIGNMKMYVLDSQLQPVPIGVAGELYIGGVGVGLGYLHDPERTSSAFIPDPFEAEGRACLYKTGDRVRYLPDGNIVYLGRTDFQVKVRGFRIELGEIEDVLHKHPEIAASVVIAREDIPAVKRLVGYIVFEDEKTMSTNTLRKYVKARLPEYMVPEQWVILEAMPLTNNGKVDRRNLPPPGNRRPDLDQDLVPPRNQAEDFLARQWCALLQLDRVGIHDRFFELGGSSIQAAQFIESMDRYFDVNIPMTAIFEAPTIAAFAAHLQTGYRESFSRKFGMERDTSSASQNPSSGKTSGDKLVQRRKRVRDRRK